MKEISDGKDMKQRTVQRRRVPEHLSENVIRHMASDRRPISYASLVKMKSKKSNYPIGNSYRDILEKQYKSKVITVVKGGTETPKFFVRVLLKERPSQSYESLVKDIEDSFRNQFNQNEENITRIFNLFGKEIKTINDFFQSGDCFIATGGEHSLNDTIIKNILEHLLPNYPQSDQIIQYWEMRNNKTLTSKERIPEETMSNTGLERVLNDIDNADNSMRPLNNISKTKTLKTKLIKRTRKSVELSKRRGNLLPYITNTELRDADGTSETQLPVSYKKIMHNTERLRAAYEDRENARMLIQEQLEVERKRLTKDSPSNNEAFSQYVKKFISNNGSTSFFKRMDDNNLEIQRKTKLKHLVNKIEQTYYNLSGFEDHITSQDVKREKRYHDSISVTGEIKKNKNQILPTIPSNKYRNLNKILESSNEDDFETQNPSASQLLSRDVEQINGGCEKNDKEHTFLKNQELQNEHSSRNPKSEIIADHKGFMNPKENTHLPMLIQAVPNRNVIGNSQGNVYNSAYEISLDNRTANHSLSKILVAPPVLLGDKIVGKMCRQISSSQIINERFEISRLLGDGNFAVVKVAVRKDNNREYAMKIIDKSRMIGKEYMIENEIMIMKLCNHQNIVKLKEEYESKEEVFLIMELIRGGDLFDAITKSIKFPEVTASKMVTDMASGLFYLHSRQIVHRDLKPENIMVLRHRDGGVTLKLADFGLAIEVKKLLFTICGTATYVAPEILSEKGYSIEIDLWALGVITYILLCGFAPFQCFSQDQEQLFDIIQRGTFEFVSPYWDKISQDVKELIRNLIEVDRRRRYTTIQVLSHKWIMNKGTSKSVSDDERYVKSLDLEEEAKLHLEHFQRKKMELRKSIGREVQPSMLSK